MSLCNQCNAEGYEIGIIFNGVDISEGKFWCLSCWNAHAAITFPAEDFIVEMAEDTDDEEEAEGYDTEEEEAMAEQTGDTSYLEAHLKAKEDQKKKDDDKTK